jgi:hypothetical protein
MFGKCLVTEHQFIIIISMQELEESILLRGTESFLILEEH